MKLVTLQEWHKLSEELSLPLLVRAQILKDAQEEPDKMLMAAMMDEMRGDALLLSLACSLKIIAETEHEKEPEIAKYLTHHADFILDDYAPHWHKFKNGLISAEWAQHVEEDLEAFTEILILTRDAFAYKDDTLYKICDALLENLNYFMAHKKDDTKAKNFKIRDKEIVEQPEYVFVSNIIQFPVNRLR